MEHAYELEEQKYPEGIIKQNNMFTITCKYDHSSTIKTWKVLYY